jgi:transcriptional regulator with XRE-family HTH domain
MDRQLIASIVEHELYQDPMMRGNWSMLEREARVSHSTIARLKRGDDRVSTATFRKIEASLGLPMDTLATAGMHDFGVLPELGVRDELIEWIMRNRPHVGDAAQQQG